MSIRDIIVQAKDNLKISEKFQYVSNVKIKIFRRRRRLERSKQRIRKKVRNSYCFN